MGFFDLFMKNKKGETIEDLIILANSGDSEAQFKVGKYYDDMEDYVEAVKWYELAEKNNHNDARFLLALYYFGGCGVTKNYEKVIELALVLLHNDNDLRGANLLGDVYAEPFAIGRITNKYYNPKSAEKYYLEIMRSGNREYWLYPAYKLGCLYGNVFYYGNDMYRNEISDAYKAVYCMFLSYKDGCDQAKEDMQIIVKNANLKITNSELESWRRDYENVHCSL